MVSYILCVYGKTGVRGDGKGREGKGDSRAQHPSPMLIDLQMPDIPIRQPEPDLDDNGQQSDPSLRLDRAAERAPRDHQRPRISCRHQQNNNIAAEPVEQDDFIPDSGHELQDHEQGGGQDAAEMQQEAGLVVPVALPVAFAGRGGGDVDAVVVEVLEAGEGEAEQGAGEDEKEGEVVTLFEAERVVDFAEQSHDDVCSLRW